MDGPLLLARYAFGPNRFGLCGPDDWRGLGEAAAAGDGLHPMPDRDITAREREVNDALRRSATDFEGALPYLGLIASANGIADPLDARVVEGYWIGNALSDRVAPGLLRASLEARFRKQLRPNEWRWLEAKPAAGATPTHAFHVFDVFTRSGLSRGGQPSDVVGLMDACRIRWGRVVEVQGSALLFRVCPLELRSGRLGLGPERVESIQRRLPNDSRVDPIVPGDIVSAHWGWLCDVLTSDQARRLRARTSAALAISSQTV